MPSVFPLKLLFGTFPRRPAVLVFGRSERGGRLLLLRREPRPLLLLLEPELLRFWLLLLFPPVDVVTTPLDPPFDWEEPLVPPTESLMVNEEDAGRS